MTKERQCVFIFMFCYKVEFKWGWKRPIEYKTGIFVWHKKRLSREQYCSPRNKEPLGYRMYETFESLRLCFLHSCKVWANLLSNTMLIRMNLFDKMLTQIELEWHFCIRLITTDTLNHIDFFNRLHTKFFFLSSCTQLYSLKNNKMPHSHTVLLYDSIERESKQSIQHAG